MNRRSSPRFRFFGASVLLVTLAFGIPAMKEGDPRLYLLTAAVPSVMLLSCTVLARALSMDRPLLTLSLYLCAAGIIALIPTDPDAAIAQSVRCCAALFFLSAGAVLVRHLYAPVPVFAASGFLGLLLVSARTLIPGISFPLTETALILLLISFAVAQPRLGTLPALLPASAGTVMLLFLQDQPLEALIWGVLLLGLVFAADGRMMIVLPAAAVLVLLAWKVWGGLSSALPDSQPGFSLPDLLSVAGLWGTDQLPEAMTASGSSFSLFPMLAWHDGMVFAGFTVLLFLPLSLRGTFIASCARSRFHAILAMGCALMIALRCLAALLAAFGLLPSTGPAFPLLTSSVSNLCAECFGLGLLCGISGQNEQDLREDTHLAMLGK